jgi:hypothetical protein
MTRAAVGGVAGLAHDDPTAAGAAARATADLLHITARVAEPAGRGALHDAARAYDRASRELHGRPPRGPGGAELRLAATSLALLSRAGRDEQAAVLALAIALAGLVDAVADLRAIQGRAEQAAAGRTAAEQVRVATTPRPGRTLTSALRPAPTRRPPEPPRTQGPRR